MRLQAVRGSVVNMATGLTENIVVAKVTSMVVLGGAAFICALVPVLIDRRLKKKTAEVQTSSARTESVLSLFLAFGGGVLLCTTFLHLLPEVSENMETLQNNGKLPKNFPLALPELVMCCGFFIMYIVEEVVHKFVRSHFARKSRQGYDNPMAVSVDGEGTLVDTYKEVLKEDKFKVAFSPPHEEDVKIIPATRRSYGSSSCDAYEVNHNHDSHAGHDHQPNNNSHSHGHGHSHNVVSNTVPSLREFLLVLALTVHEGFEGCAIGLESSVSAVWYLMMAVAIHKCVIAFCIGVEFVSGQISMKLSVFYAFVYSCASPTGIAAGLALTSSGSSSTNVASVFLQGIATGTLLYVVFFEVLKRNSSGGSGLTQMFAVIVGFFCMAAITTLIDA